MDEDKELAERVAQQLDSEGRYQLVEMKLTEWIVMDHYSGQWQSVRKFVTNWDVAGALLDQCREKQISLLIGYLPSDLALVTCQGPISTEAEYADPSKPRAWSSQVQGQVLVRTIVKACSEALADGEA